MSATPAPQPRPRSLFGKILMGFALVVFVLIAVFLGVGMFVLDGKYEVAREIVIQARPGAVHQQIGDLREWPNWLPFTKHDRSVKTTIEKPTGVGAHQHWVGKDGTGKLTFTASDEAKGVEFDMLFDEKWKSKGAFTYAEAEQGASTKVTWRMAGQNDDLMGRWMALFMSPMMGPMFDEGLADLKKKVEAK